MCFPKIVAFCSSKPPCIPRAKVKARPRPMLWTIKARTKNHNLQLCWVNCVCERVEGGGPQRPVAGIKLLQMVGSRIGGSTGAREGCACHVHQSHRSRLTSSGSRFYHELLHHNGLWAELYPPCLMLHLDVQGLFRYRAISPPLALYLLFQPSTRYRQWFINDLW